MVAALSTRVAFKDREEHVEKDEEDNQYPDTANDDTDKCPDSKICAADGVHLEGKIGGRRTKGGTFFMQVRCCP